MRWAPIMLPMLMGLLLPAVHFLPEGESAPSAISMELPERLGSWIYRQKPPSQEEIKILAADTKFAKAICLSPRPLEFDPETGSAIPDRIDLSVVLSGHDLNNSIHRPERCMPAQGHTISSSSTISLDLSERHSIPAKRLLSVQSIATNIEHTDYANFQCVTYYFFVGHNQITEDHLHRTLIDIRDRLLYGRDQRWAYVSVSMWYGKVPWIEDEVPLEEADQKIQEFLKEFSEKQIDWKMIK